MPNLPKGSQCVGCAVCADTCRHDAIVMVPDQEGFLYPKINESLCGGCNLCERSCPSLNRGRVREPQAVYAAWVKNDELRSKSSSGGVFSLLAHEVLSSGGIVFGAGFDHETWRVVHKSAEDEVELADLRGSKYVQSDTQGVYRQAKSELDRGRIVLFSGTPCQVSGFRHFLGREYDNLLLVDVVCHAVPSPLAWTQYLDQRLQAAKGGIAHVSFRDKTYGWKRFSLAIKFTDGGQYLQDLGHDSYLRGFLAELYNRPSCHNCPCRDLRSGSDLTIADYWNVHFKISGIDDDNGTSLVLVGTPKGADVWQRISDELNIRISDYADAVQRNPALVSVTKPHRNRSVLFDEVGRCPFDKIVSRLLAQSVGGRLKKLFRRMASKLKRELVGT